MALQLLEAKEIGRVRSLKRILVKYVGFVLCGVAFAVPGMAQSVRFNDQVVIDQGQALFAENCAVCHGDKAQGAVKEWHKPDASGKYPPPPLNGTAHTWHHSIGALGRTIRNGTLQIGGSMPPWGGRLSDDQIFSIIMYISSLWPEEVYQAWMQRNQQ